MKIVTMLGQTPDIEESHISVERVEYIAYKGEISNTGRYPVT